MFSLSLQLLLQAAQDLSWPQAVLMLGLAVNGTLSGILLRKRTDADSRDASVYTNVQLRLARIERALEKCPEFGFSRDGT